MEDSAVIGPVVGLVDEAVLVVSGGRGADGSGEGSVKIK